MPSTSNDPIPLHKDSDDEPGAVWITLQISPPSPNCHFAAFVDTERGTVDVRTVDFMMLQELEADDDDEPLISASRIVGVVIDWTGAPILCAMDAGNGFAAYARSFAEAEERARSVLKQIQDAGAAAATP